MKILIIDDDETIVDLLKTLLQLEGHTASELKEASSNAISSKIQTQKPDVILIDVNLKGESGLDLTKAIRMLPTISQPKIIMWSGMPFHHECITAGADAFLMKPFNPDDLLTLIQKV